MRRLIILVAMSGAACFGQTLDDAAAVNAGNLAGHTMNNYGVAPGSRFALLGSALASTASQETYPLATQLGGASVKVTVGDFTADCWLLSAQADRVVALLPSSTPPGDGTVSLTEGPNIATTKIHVLPIALGLLTRNQSELGPAFSFHDNTNPVTLVDSAQAGENVTIRGTGLGAVNGDEGAGPVPPTSTFRWTCVSAVSPRRLSLHAVRARSPASTKLSFRFRRGFRVVRCPWRCAQAAWSATTRRFPCTTAEATARIPSA
jgi:uncharacterized protein (TIGR03437 family)